jgi:DnaJ-class molecular chaperone
MTSGENYYKILDVSKKATEAEIKESYRKLAVIWHPDKNPNNVEEARAKFIEINRAYHVLSNKDARKNYDRNGTVSEDKIENSFDPFEIFKEMVEDDLIPNVITPIHANIEQLYSGFTTEVTFSRYSPCSKCDGTGTKNKKITECTDCKGNGFLIKTGEGGKMGWTINQVKCDLCKGIGIDPSVKLCKNCDGKKYLEEEICCDVDVPEGAYNRYVITLKEWGNYIPEEDRKSNSNKTRSDVLFVIDEIVDPVYKRGIYIKELKRIDQADILMEVEVLFAEAICGFKKEINYLGNSRIAIETDHIVQNNDCFVLEGMGMKIIDQNKSKTHGDLFIQFKVIPPKLTNVQRKRIWQIITDTSYPNYAEIEQAMHIEPLDLYIKKQHNKKNTSDDDSEQSDESTSDGSDCSDGSDQSD